MVSLLVFLIRTLFDLYAFVVLMRVVFQLCRVSVTHPAVQFVASMTTPVLKPFQAWLPRFGSLDLPALLLLFSVLFIKWIVIFLVAAPQLPSIFALIILTIIEIMNHVLDFFFYAILAMAVMSWVFPMGQHPLVVLLYQVTEPILRPIRQLIPPIGGFDLSALFAMIAIKCLSIILVQPIMGLLA